MISSALFQIYLQPEVITTWLLSPSTRKSGIMAEQALKSILGSQLRALRSTRGLTQEAIADELGFTPRYYAGIERGERNLSLDSIDDLAVKLAVPATSLLTIN